MILSAITVSWKNEVYNVSIKITNKNLILNKIKITGDYAQQLSRKLTFFLNRVEVGIISDRNDAITI